MSMESTTHNLVPGKMSTSASAASPCNIEYRAMSTPRFASMSAQCSRLERLCVRPTIVHSCIRAFNTGRCLEKCDMADLEARRAGAEDAEFVQELSGLVKVCGARVVHEAVMRVH